MRALLYYREKLDEHDRKIYDSLADQWMHYHGQIVIDQPHAGLKPLVVSLFSDYTLLFYADYYTLRSRQSQVEICLEARYLFEKAEAEKLLERCKAWGTYIVGQMPPGMEVSQKALWLHDVLTENVQYDHTFGLAAYNLVGVVRDKKAVCEGIAKAYKYLCDLADIPCIVVNGKVNGEPHAWNMIWIGNACAFVDVTHDLNRLPDGRYSRSHFLCSTEEMEGYQWDTSLIPRCRLHKR